MCNLLIIPVLCLLLFFLVGAGVSVWRSLSHVTHHGHHHHLHELTVFIMSTTFFLPVTTFFLPANALIFLPFSLCLSLIMLLLHLGHHIHLHYFQHVTHTSEVSILCFLWLAPWWIPVWRTCWFASDDCAAAIASQLREGVPC